MRVLAIGNRFPPGAIGGYERIFAGTVASLRAAGHEVRVLTSDEGSSDPAREDPTVHRALRWYWREGGFDRPGWRATVALERRNAAVLRRELASFAPDVVSWWGMGGMSLSLVEQVRRAGLPAVGVVGDGWMVYGPDADGWTRRFRRPPGAWVAPVAERLVGVPARPDLGGAARWLFISRRALDRTLAEGWVLPSTGIAHPGVDLERFTASEPRGWGWRLVYVGRVEPRKGVAVAVEALAALPEASLTVDGPDEAGHRAELEALAGRLGVADRVSFSQTPPDRVAETYAAADAVVFPVTWDEPWGLVPLEAMAVGRPVVATGTGGSAEYLEDGRNALLAPPGDAAALAAAVRRLAVDDGLRERLVSTGRETASTYSQAAFEASVLAALSSVAGSADGHRGPP